MFMRYLNEAMSTDERLMLMNLTSARKTFITSARPWPSDACDGNFTAEETLITREGDTENVMDEMK